MKKRQFKLWTTILFSFTISLFQQNDAQAATIEGASEVCLSDCVTYQITDAFGGSYFWTITGGDQPTATGESITICWESIGAGSLEVLDVAAPINEAITTLDITVNSLPFAEILSPLFPSCAVFDSTFADGTEQLSALECQTACAFSTGNYYSVLDANLSYEWIIEGDVSHVANNNMVDVEWGDAGAGSILLRVTDNTTNCQDSTLICMDILAIPDATIETDLPIPANNTITVCINQPIQLYNNGSDFSTWQWDLGNGTTSTELNPVASFDASGTYTVSLTNNSACYCTNTGTLTIEVIDAIAPEIDCVSTLCAGTSGTYYAVTSCSDFTWTVSSNGTIEDGGQSTDDFITVFWQDGTEGLVELLASSCPGNDCSVPTVAHVPIISPTGDIEGPTLVCKDIGERYTAPFFNGVDYTWSITGNGQIVEGYGTNEIMVEWSTWGDNNALIEVVYDHCYLECSGTASLLVQIRPRFIINGDLEACLNGNTSYSTLQQPEGWGYVNSDWSITTPSGVLQSNVIMNDNTISPVWSEGIGMYTLHATATDLDQVCHPDYSLQVLVTDPPPPVENIEGATEICPENFYAYTAFASHPLENVHWEITNGAQTTQTSGNNISVLWGNAPPYELLVWHTENQSPFCSSDTLSMTMTTISGLSLTGIDEVCQEQSSIVTASASYAIDYDWTIIPPEAGSIITQNNDGTAEIFWHQAGNATVQLNICGEIATHNMTVFPKPEPNVPNASVCAGETATMSTTDAYDSYNWFDAQGNLLSTNPTVDVAGGFYNLDVITSTGCSASTTFSVKTYASIEVSITSPDPLGFCAGEDVNLYALENSVEYETYEWYRDGVLVNDGFSVFNADEYGDYYVIVTNENGCTAQSPTTTLFEYCGDNVCQGCGSCTNAGLDIDCESSIGVIDAASSIGTYCNEVTLINNSINALPGSFQWFFGDKNFPDSILFAFDGSYVYEQAGYYPIVLAGLVPSNVPGIYCLVGDLEEIIVPVDANFDADSVCVGQPMPFYDLSTFVPTTAIADWSWNFDDPTSGADNTAIGLNPNHTFNNAGTYDVALTITDQSGCLSTITKTIEVFEAAPPIFVANATTCENIATAFAADMTTPDVVSWAWDFGDVTNNTASEPNTYHYFETPGNYIVSLTVTNVLGCQNTSTQMITVEANDLALGSITLSNPSPICEGETTVLTAPAGGVSYQWSNGLTTDNIEIGQAGNYQVSVTDVNGCEAVTSVFVEITPKPDAPIWGYTTDMWGLPEADQYGVMNICEGDRANIRTQYSWSTFNYLWSDGVTDYQTSYSNWSANGLLPIGIHEFDVTLTEIATGCSNTSLPFTVYVHPNPTAFTLSTDTPDPCVDEDNPATILIDSPQADLTYYWENGEVGTSITVTKGGTYNVEAVNEFGCGIQQSIYLQSMPDINKIPSGCYECCAYDTLCVPTLNVASYQWFLDGSAITGPEGTIKDVVMVESGVYQLELTGWNGCVKLSDPLDMTVYETQDSTINLQSCAGQAVLFESMSLLPGIHTFTHTSIITGCDSIVTVDIADVPVLNEFLTVEVCQGETFTYESDVLLPNTITDFPFITDAGCDSIVTVEVIESPAPTFDVMTQRACWNQPNGSISIDNVVGGTGIFEYSIDGVNFQTDPLFEDLAAGTYTVYLQDQNGCLYTATATIIEKAALALEPQDDVVIDCAEGMTTLKALVMGNTATPLNYQWSAGTTDSVLTVTEKGTYSVTVSDECGEVVQQINVTGGEAADLDPFVLPTAFSPNQDGMNDAYCPMPKGNVAVTDYRFRIFDQWGEPLFASTTMTEGWEGKHQAKPVELGLYVWYYEATLDNCGEAVKIFKKGHVMLVR